MMDANWIGNLIVITAITSLAAFGIWRGFGISFKGWGIELRVEKPKSHDA